MTRSLAAFLAVLALLCASAAHAQHRVTLRVVELAGGRAYFSPGESAGVRQGSDLVVGHRHYRVIAVSATYAVVDVGRGSLEVGDEARVATREETSEAPAGHPRPMSAFEGQWPAAVHPAETQTPTPVPLGVSAANRRYDVVVSTNVMGAIPTSGPAEAIFRGDLRAQVYAEPFDGVPLWARADLALQAWAAGDLGSRQGGDARPWLQIRELALGYGSESATDFYAVLGRIRGVAAGMGQLDGLRLRTPSLEGFTVGAFGGFVPDPRSGIPDFNTSRFGLELAYRDLRSSWRPSIHVVTYGSIFRGALDERRANAQLSFFPGPVRFGAGVELSLYDNPNPWNVLQLEVSSANVDTAVRFGNFDIGARFDMRKPERSNWLASVMPASWLCTPLPMAGNVAEPCSGKDDSRWLATLDAGLRVDDVVFRGGGTFIQYAQDSALTQLGGYANVRANRIGTERLRADLFLSSNLGALVNSYAGRASVTVVILPDVLDVSAHYRLSWNDYRAGLGGFFQHAAGGTVNVWPIPDIAIMVIGEGITSQDFDVLLVSLNVAWRPVL